MPFKVRLLSGGSLGEIAALLASLFVFLHLQPRVPDKLCTSGAPNCKKTVVLWGSGKCVLVSSPRHAGLAEVWTVTGAPTVPPSRFHQKEKGEPALSGFHLVLFPIGLERREPCS